MKALKFLGSTVLLCLFVVACAKSNKEEQARISGGGDKTTIEETDKAADKAASDSRARVEKDGYTGKNVTLTKNTGDKAASAGTITLFEEDARRLYERLRIVATLDAKDTASDTKTKQGKNLACSEFVRSENKVYSCILSINYSTGKLASADKEITVDKDAKANTEAYSKKEGGQLSILQGAEGNGILSVLGEDAKVLYEVLTVEEKSLVSDGWMADKEKIGENLRCYKHTFLKTDAAPSYTCSLSVNVNDGTVKASDVAAPAKEEKAKEETTTTEETPAAPAAPAPEAPTDGTAVGV
jgi:hypothetical protein